MTGLLSLLVLPARCAEPAEALESIARLMDEQAIAVVRVDATRAEPEMLRTFFSLLPDEFKKVHSPKPDRNSGAGEEDKLGLETYWILSVPTSQRIPVLRAKRLREGTPVATGATVVDGILLDGEAPLVAKALAAREAVLTDSPSRVAPHNLAAALAAVADAPIVFAFVPSADQRRVLHEQTPDLPGEVGGSHLRDLLRTIDWFAIGYHNDQALRIVLNTPSETAAIDTVGHVEALLKGLIALVGSGQTESAPPEPLRQLAPLAEAFQPQQRGNQVVLELDGGQLALALQPAFAAATNAADRQTAMNRFKTIAIAMHNYHSAVKGADGKYRFPDAASLSPDGKPLLSWRVHVLPYLDQDALYREFHLDEPWDSEHNKKLIERMPDVYRLPGVKVAEGKTCVLLPVGKSTLYADGKGQQIQEIIDGTSNTIMAVESDDEHAVIWTAPEDLPYDSEQPSAGLGRHYGDGFLALVADGSVRFLPASIEEKQLKALFSSAGREVIDRPE